METGPQVRARGVLPRARLSPAQKEAQMFRHTVIVIFVMLLLAGSSHAGLQPLGAQGAEKSASVLVNLNVATAVQLEALPGVGPKTAALIIDYRQKNGGFKKIEELMNVRGVGEKSFLKIKHLITVTPAKPERSVAVSQN